MLRSARLTMQFFQRDSTERGGDVEKKTAVNLGTGFLSVAGFGVVIALWYLTALTGLVSPQLLPRPDQVLGNFFVSVMEKDLLVDIAASLGRVLAGMLIGLSLGTPVGMLLAWYPTTNKMFGPVVNFFRSIPPIALSPLVIVYLGIGEVARVSILVYGIFLTSVVIVFEGVSAIEEIYVRAARVLGATEGEIFRRILVPLSVPQVFVALRLSIGAGWSTLVAAELLAAQQGLGAVIQNAGNFFDIPTIYMGICCIGVVALIMDYAARRLMHRAVRWQERVIR